MEVLIEASLVGGCMSIEMLNRALNIEGLTPTKKFILVLLGNYADENGQCYPSHRHIANKIGLKDTKGIQQTIKLFEQLGYLKIEHRKKEDGGFTSNKYTLTIPKGSDTPTPVKEVRERVQEPVNTKDNTKTITLSDEGKSFTKFWLYYPRKVGKANCGKIFTKKCTGSKAKVTHLELVQACALFSKECEMNHTESQYIPHPSTWLNQERYWDYLDEDSDVVKNIKSKKGGLNNIAG